MARISISLFLISLLLFGCKYDVENEDLLQFETTFPLQGNQESNRLITVDDGVLIIGSTLIGAEKKAFLMKTDFSGGLIWHKNLGQATEGWSLKATNDNALIVTGTINTASDNIDAVLIKTDLDGNMFWQKSFGGPMADLAKDVIALENGDFMMVGITQSFGSGAASIYVIKTDSNGNEIWSRTFGGGGLDGASELVEVNGFEIMILGFTGSFGAGDRDIYLQGVSMEGDSLASFTLGGSGYEESQAIAKTADGGFVMCNHSASIDPTHKLLATKLNANYQTVWETEFGGLVEHEGGEGVLSDSEGNYVFLGRTNSFGNEEQLYFIKTDANGNVLEELNFGAAGNQSGTDIIEHNGSYYILGTSSINGDSDVMLIKRPM